MMLILYFQYLEQCPAWRTEQTFLKLIHITLAIAISLPSKSGKFWLPGTPTHVPEWTSMPKVLCVCGHGWLSGCMSRSRSDGQPALGLHLLSSSIPALILLSLRRSFLWGTSWASCLAPLSPANLTLGCSPLSAFSSTVCTAPPRKYQVTAW